MRVAALRSFKASAAPFGLDKLYVAAFGMEGTETVRDTSALGVSPVALQPTSASTGDGSVSRYLPSQPTPEGEPGSAVPQMSEPSKWDLLELAYPVRWTTASRP
jgi:hypothetical protein